MAIINNEYGFYALDISWSGPHGFTNDRSPEVIWSSPSQFYCLQYNWFYSKFYHYNSRQYFNTDMGADNGTHLTPSRKPDGNLYKNVFSLGSRNFANQADPNPATAANLDAQRFLDEWSIEFLAEGRRRTDLIRWKMFTTAPWWDHQASGSVHLNRFPVPTEAISGNNNLTQNPGY